MARLPRNFLVGSIYHVINRGVEKRDIFIKGQDYSRFILGLELLNNVSSGVDIWKLVARKNQTTNQSNKLAQRGGRGGSVPPLAVALAAERLKPRRALTEILAFALMPNHYHLILRETAKAGISEFMKKLGGYTTYFNNQYQRVGPLFQSRYKAVEVSTDEQAKVLFNYVHANPLGTTANATEIPLQLKQLLNYKSCSYVDYFGHAGTSRPFVSQSYYLGLFGSRTAARESVSSWLKLRATNLSALQKLISKISAGELELE